MLMSDTRNVVYCQANGVEVEDCRIGTMGLCVRSDASLYGGCFFFVSVVMR